MSSIGGELVGYGIGHKNGEIDFTWLDKPVHNRITHNGIEHLLRIAGSNSEKVNYDYSDKTKKDDLGKYNKFVGYFKTETLEHWGALYYAGYGSGTHLTKFYDTELEKQIEITDKKFVGSPYCGSKFVYDTGDKTPSITLHRISHQFSEVSEITYVNEIAWFGKYKNPNINDGKETYVMFSRIVLPKTIELKPGDFLITTYELKEKASVSGEIKENILLNDNTVNWQIMRYASDSNGLTWGDTLNYDSISINGTPNNPQWFLNGNETTYYSRYFMNMPVFLNCNISYIIMIVSETNVDNVLRTLYGINKKSNYTMGLEFKHNINIKDYKPNTYYREFKIDKDASYDFSYNYGAIMINGYAYIVPKNKKIYFSRPTFRTTYSTPDTIKVLNGEDPDK